MSDVVISAENTLVGELASGQNLTGNMSPSTDNYEAFKNKPKINGVELVGDKSLTDLGIVDTGVGQTTIQNGEIFNDYKNNKAIGEFSHAEGGETIASGRMSHAGGYKTIASAEVQTAIGKFNVEDANALLIVGNGTSDTNRKNAFMVNKDGSAEVQVTGDTENSVTTRGYVDNYIESVRAYVDTSIGDIDAVLDNIIAIQNSLIGGESV